MKQTSSINMIWRVLYPVLLHRVILYIVTYGGLFILSSQVDLEAADPYAALNTLYNQHAAMLTALAGAVSIVPLFWFYLKDKKMGQVIEAGNGQRAGILIWLLAAGAAVGIGFGVNNLIALSGISNYSEAYQQTNDALYGGGFLIRLIGLGVAVPLAEELVFRGLIYNRLRMYAGIKAAACLSAVGFAVYHGNIVQGIYACILSVVLIFLYERLRSVWAPVLGHMVVNTISILFEQFGLGDWFYKNYFNFISGSLAALIGGIACVTVIIKIKDR